MWLYVKETKMRNLKQFHSAEKCESGDPLGFLKLQFAAKFQKNRRWDHLETLTIEKNLTMPEKLKRDPSVSLGFANARKKFGLKQELEPATSQLSYQLVLKKTWLACNLTLLINDICLTFV